MSEIDFQHVRNFVALQRDLIAELSSCFLLPEDLHQVPRRGRIHLGQDLWYLRKHGAGVRFLRGRSPRLIVETHDKLPNGNVVDAWRLLWYLDSLRIKSNEDIIEIYLKKQCRNGLLSQLDARAYELVLDS